MDQILDKPLCKYCHFPLSDTYFFCPNCGKKAKEPPLSTQLGKQISLYALSLFVPPFGLWPAIKYLNQGDEKSKRIGLIAFILSIIGIIGTIWITMDYVDQANKAVNLQLNQYQNLGL